MSPPPEEPPRITRRDDEVRTGEIFECDGRMSTFALSFDAPNGVNVRFEGEHFLTEGEDYWISETVLDGKPTAILVLPEPPDDGDVLIVRAVGGPRLDDAPLDPADRPPERVRRRNAARPTSPPPAPPPEPPPTPPDPGSMTSLGRRSIRR